MIRSAKGKNWLPVVVHTCDLSTYKPEARGQPGLQCETVPQTNKQAKLRSFVAMGYGVEKITNNAID